MNHPHSHPEHPTCHHCAPKAAATPGNPDALYTCPMHPEVRQRGRGSCPRCGMALEPVNAAEATGDNTELRDMWRRLWIAALLALPVIALEMGSHVFGAHRYIDARISQWIQFALATPVVWWAGWPFFERAVASVRHRSLKAPSAHC